VAHLKSRIRGNFVASTKTYGADDDPQAPKPPTHTVTAPVPLLRVTVQDGGRQAQAFCSIIPYMQVFQPDGTVASRKATSRTSWPGFRSSIRPRWSSASTAWTWARPWA
jgi:hypothetical protein